MPEYSDVQLDAVLASVGRHLVTPDGAQFAVPSGADRPVHAGASRLVLAAAIVLVVVVAIGLIVTPVREAVADWFGIGNTSVERVPVGQGDPTGLPAFSADARPTTAAGAAARLGRPVPVVTALGRSERLMVPPEGGVLMAWPRGRTTLWVLPDEGDGDPLLRKLLSYADTARPVNGLGEQALTIAGDHVLQTPTRRVAADRVLLWIEDGLQYRLESDLSLRRMIEIARSVQARR